MKQLWSAMEPKSIAEGWMLSVVSLQQVLSLSLEKIRHNNTENCNAPLNRQILTTQVYQPGGYEA